jgi:hypothetical protein
MKGIGFSDFYGRLALSPTYSISCLSEAPFDLRPPSTELPLQRNPPNYE